MLLAIAKKYGQMAIAQWPTDRLALTAHSHSSSRRLERVIVLLSSQLWPMPSMSRGVINCAKQFLSHPFSRIKLFDQLAVDREPVLTSTTSAKIGKTAIDCSLLLIPELCSRGQRLTCGPTLSTNQMPAFGTRTLHPAELTVCCRLIRFSWYGASCPREIWRFFTVSLPEVQKKRGADVDFQAVWAHVPWPLGQGALKV